MKRSYLFPNNFKKIGYAIAIPFALILILHICKVPYLNFDFKTFGIISTSGIMEDVWFTATSTDFQATIVPVILIIGLLFIAFSKEKIEDEMIEKIREQSLVWAVIINSIILVLAILLIYGLPYLYLLIIQIFSVLILFIAKFNVELYRFKKVTKDEE
jgi:small-conductance mechanosensitive channel